MANYQKLIQSLKSEARKLAEKKAEYEKHKIKLGLSQKYFAEYISVVACLKYNEEMQKRLVA